MDNKPTQMLTNHIFTTKFKSTKVILTTRELNSYVNISQYNWDNLVPTIDTRIEILKIETKIIWKFIGSFQN